MTAHRFEIGECVTYVEKRFPNGERCTELVVAARLSGVGEPLYQLRGPEGLEQCVLAESQLRPTAPDETARRLDAPPPGDPAGGGPPWSA
jgi:hypothetical protein